MMASSRSSQAMARHPLSAPTSGMLVGRPCWQGLRCAAATSKLPEPLLDDPQKTCSQLTQLLKVCALLPLMVASSPLFAGSAMAALPRKPLFEGCTVVAPRLPRVRKQRAHKQALAAITMAAPIPAPTAAPAAAQPGLQQLLTDTATQAEAALAVAQASLLSSTQLLQASLAPGARQLQSAVAALTVPQVAGITVAAALTLMMLKGIFAGGGSSSSSSSHSTVADVQKTTSSRVTEDAQEVVAVSVVENRSLPRADAMPGVSVQRPASAAPTKPPASEIHSVTKLDSGMLALIALASAAIDGATKPSAKTSAASGGAAGVKKAAPFTASGPKADPNMLALLAVAGVTLDGVTPMAKLLASNLSSNGKAAVTGSEGLLLKVEDGVKWAQATGAEASANAAAVSSELVSTSEQLVGQLSQAGSALAVDASALVDEALSHLTVYPPLDSPRYESPGPMATSFRGSAGSASAAAAAADMAWAADIAAERIRMTNRVYPALDGPRYVSSGPLTAAFDRRHGLVAAATSGSVASAVAAATSEVEELRVAAEFRSTVAAREAAVAVAIEAEAAALQLYRGLVAEYREVVAVREAEEAAVLEAAAQASLVLGGDDASPVAIDLAYAAVQSHQSSGVVASTVAALAADGGPFVLMHDAAALEAALKATAADFSTAPAFLQKHQVLMAEKQRREAASAAAAASSKPTNRDFGGPSVPVAGKGSSTKTPAWDAIGQLLRQFSK